MAANVTSPQDLERAPCAEFRLLPSVNGTLTSFACEHGSCLQALSMIDIWSGTRWKTREKPRPLKIRLE